MTQNFPTTGFDVEVPTIAETNLTGWLATIRFARHGAQYHVRFRHLRAPECLRNGRAIDWSDLTPTARSVANKAADWLNEAGQARRAAKPESSDGMSPGERYSRYYD